LNFFDSSFASAVESMNNFLLNSYFDFFHLAQRDRQNSATFVNLKRARQSEEAKRNEITDIITIDDSVGKESHISNREGNQAYQPK